MRSESASQRSSDLARSSFADSFIDREVSSVIDLALEPRRMDFGWERIIIANVNSRESPREENTFLANESE